MPSKKGEYDKKIDDLPDAPRSVKWQVMTAPNTTDFKPVDFSPPQRKAKIIRKEKGYDAGSYRDENRG